jgi:Uma2 family endonuclease
MAVRELITPDMFEDFVRQPEHRERNFELISGEIVEVVSNSLSSINGVRISALIQIYLFKNDIGVLTGADGGYIVGNDRYIPDVAFVRHERYMDNDVDGYQPIAPDLAIEVLSPTNDERMMRRKVINYLAAGTTVWVFDPLEETVEVNVPGKAVVILRIGDTLDGGDVLPGFKIELKDVFEKRPKASAKPEDET